MPIDLTPRGLARRLPSERKAQARAMVQRARQLRQRWQPEDERILERTTPVSNVYGADRGKPIDRTLLERWLSGVGVAGDRVLEVGSADYAGSLVPATSVDILDISPENRASTVLADLGVPGSLPLESWQVIICTQTLQYVDDPAVALENLRAGLEPGGTLLISVPACVARVDPTWPDVDRWRFTPAGLSLLLEQAGFSEVAATGLGDFRAGLAFWLGMASEEIDELRVLESSDFPVLAAAVATK